MTTKLYCDICEEEYSFSSGISIYGLGRNFRNHMDLCPKHRKILGDRIKSAIDKTFEEHDKVDEVVETRGFWENFLYNIGVEE